MSVRVPSVFAKELASHCKHSNITVSEYMQKGFTKVGMMELDEITISKDTKEMLVALGIGSGVGILTYKAVYGTLIKKGYTKQKAEIFAVMSGITSGLLSGYGVDKLIKAFK